MLISTGITLSVIRIVLFSCWAQLSFRNFYPKVLLPRPLVTSAHLRNSSVGGLEVHGPELLTGELVRNAEPRPLQT